MTISLLLLLTLSNSWWSRRRRRRRRSCSSVNCQVGGWTSWSSCSHQCGTSGTQARTRQQTRAASCGGTRPYHLREMHVACNREMAVKTVVLQTTMAVAVDRDTAEHVVSTVS